MRATATSERAGLTLVRAGYAVALLAIAAAIVESIRAWGDATSLGTLGCVAVIWAGSGLIAYGRGLRGELAPGAFSVGRGLLGLPASLGLAYFGPAIEHFGAWWALLLPHLTFHLLGPTIGLPHLLALTATILVAPIEIIASAAVPQLLIVSPLTAIFGRGNPVVESVRDMVGGIELTHGSDAAAPGREESTVWAGESALG